MRNTLPMAAAVLGLAIGPAFAQNSSSTTMSPPAPNASAGVREPTNSLPNGAGTASRVVPGDDVSTTTMAPRRPMPMSMSGMPDDQGMTGMHRMRGPMRHGRMMHGRAGMTGDAASTEMDAPRGGEYRGGAGSPRSNRASNIAPSNTRSEIAPRLPDPAAINNTPEGYLAAAQRALDSGKTGAAQEALERAETRVLSRSTDSSMAASPADMPMVQQIGQARRALAARDVAAAKSAISAAMAPGG